MYNGGVIKETIAAIGSVVSVLQAEDCNMDTTQTQPHQIPNTQRTENKTTNVVIQQHSRKLLMVDILISKHVEYIRSKVK